MATAADGEPGVVLQDGQMAVLGVGLDPGNSLDVYDYRTVDTHKALGIQRALQAG